MVRLTLILLVLSLAPTQQALACSFTTPLIDINWGVRYAGDGSFRNAGDLDQITGLSAFDLLDGRIGQVIVEGGPCSSSENILFVDCNAREMTVVSGVCPSCGDEEVIINGSYHVDNFLLPDGLLADVTGQSIVAMRRYLISHGGGDANVLLRSNSEEKPRDQFNPFAGCKVLYPGSPGAAYEWPMPTELTE